MSTFAFLKKYSETLVIIKVLIGTYSQKTDTHRGFVNSIAKRHIILAVFTLEPK